LLLFGPEQLPKLARQLGEAMRHVQNTTHSFMQEMERAADTQPGPPAFEQKEEKNGPQLDDKP
jgi:Sec-independent protein translocase protein TatA